MENKSKLIEIINRSLSEIEELKKIKRALQMENFQLHRLLRDLQDDSRDKARKFYGHE